MSSRSKVPQANPLLRANHRRIEAAVVALALAVLALTAVLLWYQATVVERTVTHIQAVDELQIRLLEARLTLIEDPASTAQEAEQARDPLDEAAAICTALIDGGDPRLDDQRALAPVQRTAEGRAWVTAACTRVEALQSSEQLAADPAGESSASTGPDSAVLSEAAYAAIEADAALSRRVAEARGVLWLLRAGVIVMLVLLLASTLLLMRWHRRALDAARLEVEHRSSHDNLTGLGNRSLFRASVETLLEQGDRDLPVSVVFVDLDGFKNINDISGQAAGDTVLTIVADRLRRAVRPDDTVARLGGDEFAVICPGLPAGDARALGERVLERLAAPMQVLDSTLHVSASAGIASGAIHSTRRADLVRAADIALYVAKAKGRGSIVAYDPEIHSEVLSIQELTHDLGQAVEQGELVLAYQPIIDLRSGKLRRVEALVRWQHPERGLLTPDAFIPLAEESGDIRAIGSWVLGEACRQVCEWQQRHNPALGVAVNVSMDQLDGGGLVDDVAQALSDSGLDPASLTLELTESMIMQDPEGTRRTVTALHALGVRIAIDDFGTGHSALARLRDLPLDELKIDRAFVTDVPSDEQAATLVQAILALSASLGLEVTAEGIETPAQLAFLAGQDCASGQGYLLSRPMDAAAMAALLVEPSTVGRSTPEATDGHESEDMLIAEAVRLLDGDDPIALRELLRRLSAASGLESTYVTSIDWDREVQHLAAVHNAGTLAIPEGAVIPWGETVCKRALEGGVRQTDDVSKTFPDAAAAHELGIRTYVGIPVLDPDGHLIGTLCGASGEQVDVPDGVIRLMELFAGLLGSRLHPPGRRGGAGSSERRHASGQR